MTTCVGLQNELQTLQAEFQHVHDPDGQQRILDKIESVQQQQQAQGCLAPPGQIGTRIAHIIVGGNALYATNLDTGDIWKYNGTPLDWTRIGGPGSMFAADNTTLYGVSPDKSALFQWTGVPNQWLQIGTGTDQIITGSIDYWLFSVSSLYATSPTCRGRTRIRVKTTHSVLLLQNVA